MANKILTETPAAYYESVRRKLGATENLILDADIDDPMIIGIAEANIIKLVPDYTLITDETELLFLRFAVISYTASLLCPLMAAKHKIDVKTIETAWKKDRINWTERVNELVNEALAMLQQITSVTVNFGESSIIFALAKSERGLEEAANARG